MVRLAVERCDGRAREAEIKALFQRNGRTGFEQFFDRAYPQAMAAGGASWVARSAQGELVGHIAAFPWPCCRSGREVRAAMLVDLLFDAAYRNFWYAAELCRRALTDLRAGSEFAFIYSDPTPAAEAVLRAVGMSMIDTFRRFVSPTNPLYTHLFRLGTRIEPLMVERTETLDTPALTGALQRLQAGSRFRGRRSLDLYATRLGGEILPNWHWLLMRPRGMDGSPVAAVLAASIREARMLSVVDVLWDEERVTPVSILAAVRRQARADGCRKVSMTALMQSGFADALRRLGFIRRADRLPLLVLQIDSAAPLPPSGEWFLSAFDSSAW
jgi:GNAT superfamily N-acetyltransferase